MSTSTLKTNVLECKYDYFTMYSSTITLECNHDFFNDYFNEYPVSNIKATFMESLGVILVLYKNTLIYCTKLCRYSFVSSTVHSSPSF